MNRITLTEPIMNFRAFSTLTLLVPLALAVACGDKGTASETDQTTSVDTESGSESESGESETDPAETEGTTGGTDITGTQTGSSTTGETESTDPTDPSESTDSTDPSESESDSTVTTDGTDSDPTNPTDPSDTETDTTGVMGCEDASAPIVDLQNSFAIREGDIPDDSSSGSGSSTSTGPDLDPDTLFVRLSNHKFHSCEDPYNWGECEGELQWTVSFQLSPEQQKPGLYTMEELNGFESETGPNEDNTCWFGGGTLWTGNVLIEQISDGEVIGRLCGVDPVEDFDPNGSFSAPRCL